MYPHPTCKTPRPPSPVGGAEKIVFKDGRVYSQNRFVSTGVWDPNAPDGEGSAGAVRGWTPRPGGWRKNVFKLPGNPVNTSVMVKGGKLFALAEGGRPFEMDPVTLETVGESDLGGIQVRGRYDTVPLCAPSIQSGSLRGRLAS